MAECEQFNSRFKLDDAKLELSATKHTHSLDLEGFLLFLVLFCFLSVDSTNGFKKLLGCKCFLFPFIFQVSFMKKRS